MAYIKKTSVINNIAWTILMFGIILIVTVILAII